MGIPSVLLVCIVVLRLPYLFQTIRKQEILQLLLILLGYSLIITLISRGSIFGVNYDYRQLCSILLYILFAGAIASFKWNEAEICLLVKFMVSGLMLTALICFIDGVGIVDIPRINDSPVTHPDYDFYIPYGQFRHRSVMSLYLAVIYGFLFVISDDQKVGRVWRYGILLSGGYFFWLLIASRNRAGPSALILSLCAYYIFFFWVERKSHFKKVSDFLIVIVFAGAIFGLTADPAILTSYWNMWLGIPGISTVFNWFYGGGIPDLQLEETLRVLEGGMVRVNLVNDAISRLHTFPYGSGLRFDPHMWFVVDIIYTAGFFGVLWLMVVAGKSVGIVFKLLRKSPASNAVWAVVTGLTCWVLVGITYNSLNMGISWGFIGIFLSMHRDQII